MTRQEALEILGLPERTPKDDVRAAWKRLGKQVHPDTGGTALLFQMVTAAKETLLQERPEDPPPSQPKPAPKWQAPKQPQPQPQPQPKPQPSAASTQSWSTQSWSPQPQPMGAHWITVIAFGAIVLGVLIAAANPRMPPTELSRAAAALKAERCSTSYGEGRGIYCSQYPDDCLKGTKCTYRGGRDLLAYANGTCLPGNYFDDVSCSCKRC